MVSASVFGQQRLVTGNITDAVSLQPVVAGSIRMRPSGGHAISDESGNFRVFLKEAGIPVKMVISAIGYTGDTVILTEGQYHYSITLAPAQEILSEVVVTGVSKATLARENPVAVVAVSRRSLDQTIESNIIDVLVKNVPGLNAVNTGPNVSKPFIRGLGYNRVLTLYDGVRQEGQQWGDEHGLEADAYNIEKGEVIKGPASLMYGSDATAGVVSIMTAMPHESDGKFHGRFMSEYQSNNDLLGNGLLLTHSGNHWSYALRGSYRIAKNYTNPVDGRVYNSGFRESNASASIRYKNAAGFSDLNVSGYNNLQGIPDGSRDSLTRAFTKQIAEGTMDDIRNRPIVPDEDLNSYRLSPLHQHIRHYRLYSNHHYPLGNGDIDLMLAFQQNKRIEYNHPTMTRQPGMYVDLNTMNYSLRYNLPALQNTELTVGFNGMYQNNRNRDATDFPIPDYRLVDAGSFLYAKWKKNNWTVSGGIRYDMRWLSGNDFYIKNDPSTGFNRQAFYPDTSGAYLQFPSFQALFKGMSMSIGSTFRVSDKINLKANLARGYRAPSITEFASNGLDPGAHIIYLGNRNFKPEFNLQSDLGAEFHDKNIAASLSLFNNNIQDYIYLSALTDDNGDPVINTQGNKTFQYQQSSAQIYGLEATFSVQPSSIKGFSFSNAVSLIYGFNRHDDAKNKGLEGEFLPLMPPFKWLSSINQSVSLPSRLLPMLNVKAEFDVNAAQHRYLALNGTETFTPGYTLVNISLHARINYNEGNGLEFQLQANNIFNGIFQSNLSRLKYFEYFTNSPTGRLGIFGMGRNICAKLVLPF